MMLAVLGFFVYTKVSHLAIPDVRAWVRAHLAGIVPALASLVLVIAVLLFWQGRRFLRLARRRTGAVVVAEAKMGRVGGIIPIRVPVSLTLDDLRHHAHFVGPTGSGKTVTLENVFKGYVLSRHTAGVFVDPKDGDATQWLLETLPDDARDRVVLIRPDADHIVGLNVLQVLLGESEELVADQAVAILRRVLRRTGGDNAWGGRMDVVASNGIRTLMKRPGSTICDLPLLLGRDPKPRDRILREVHLDDPFVLEPFWESYDPKGQGVDSFVARLQGLLVRPSVRGMLGQATSTIDVSRLLGDGAIILVDIPKARIGEDATALLGSFFVARLWQVAQSRQDRRPVCIVLDEFQNFVDDKLAEVLTESRAYNVGWFLANQFTHQLPDKVLKAVESCALTKMRLTGPDERRVFRATLRRRLMPDLEVPVVLRGPAGRLGRAHATSVADTALKRHGMPRAEVEAALRAKLGHRPAVTSPAPTEVPDEGDDEYAEHWT